MEKNIEIILDNEKEWRRHILGKMEKILVEQVSQGKKIESLDVRSGLWGAASGGIVVLISLALIFLKKSLLKYLQ